MITNLIGWMLFGLIAGAVARFLHPGYDRMGLAGTMILGVLGSLLGGGFAFMLRLGVDPYQPAGWMLSILGAILLLWLGFVGSRVQATN